MNLFLKILAIILIITSCVIVFKPNKMKTVLFSNGDVMLNQADNTDSKFEAISGDVQDIRMQQVNDWAKAKEAAVNIYQNEALARQIEINKSLAKMQAEQSKIKAEEDKRLLYEKEMLKINNKERTNLANLKKQKELAENERKNKELKKQTEEKELNEQGKNKLVENNEKKIKKGKKEDFIIGVRCDNDKQWECDIKSRVLHPALSKMYEEGLSFDNGIEFIYSFNINSKANITNINISYLDYSNNKEMAEAGSLILYNAIKNVKKKDLYYLPKKNVFFKHKVPIGKQQMETKANTELHSFILKQFE